MYITTISFAIAVLCHTTSRGTSATVPLCYRATPIEFPTPIEYPAIRYRILWFDDTQDTKVVE